MRTAMIGFILCFSTVCFASETWLLNSLSIVLPNDLKQSFKEESDNVNMYIFGSPSMQIKMVVLHQAPKDQADNQAWQLDMLGKQIALWQQGSKLPLDSQKEILNNKPNSEKIGKYTYQTVAMSFPSQDVKFLNVVNNEATYMFTLVSLSQEPKQKMEQMAKLIEALSSAELRALK